MLKVSDNLTIFVATDPMDLRKSIDGLSYAVIEALHSKPQDGSLYVFHNKGRDKIKILYWHKNGFVVHYKRLEKCRFKIPKNIKEVHFTINSEQLSWLLAGLDFCLMEQFNELNFENYF